MERLRVVVAGQAATYPLGGLFWEYVQHAVGLSRLGHEVLYVEDSGRWCYDPAAGTFVADGSRNAAWLALGVPTVVQDTGIGRHLPTGEGILPFATLAEAEEAIARVAADPDRHARAARSIAAECFAAERVLADLLEAAR